MATDIDVLLPEVMTFAPSCPEPIALRHIREAAKEICQRARFWRETDQFAVDPDCQSLCTVQDASIYQIEWAKLGDYKLEPVTVGWLDHNVQDWAEPSIGGSARYVTQLTPNSVAVVPRISGQLKIRLVLYPSRDAMTLPNFLVDQYATEIGKGAAGRILVTPSAELANPQLGSALIAEFKAFLDTLSIAAVKGQQNAPLRTTGRYF